MKRLGQASPGPEPAPARRRDLGLRPERVEGSRGAGEPPCPGPWAGLGAAGPGSGLPRSGRARQAHLHSVKSACSPPLERRLRSTGLARPAQPLGSAALRSPRLSSAQLGARLLPDTSGAAWLAEAIL